MTVLEVDSRRHHADVAIELIRQAKDLYEIARDHLRMNHESDALRLVLEGDMKMSRALENINEVMG